MDNDISLLDNDLELKLEDYENYDFGIIPKQQKKELEHFRSIE